MKGAVERHGFGRSGRQRGCTVPEFCLLVLTAGSSSVTFALLSAAGIPSRQLCEACRHGPVKAALEALVRYLAHELGPKRIRANAFLPAATRAASGIEHFDGLLNENVRKAPLHRTVDSCEVGRAGAVARNRLPDRHHRQSGAR